MTLPRATWSKVKAKTVESLTAGCIDMHAHFGPDSKLERSVDLFTLLETASDLKLRAIALKSKDYPTGALAQVGKRLYPNIEPLGAICLDHDVGGLNAEAVSTLGGIGGRIVWLPTFSSVGDMDKFFKRPDLGITCLDKNGELSQATVDVLEQVKKHDLVLATGHISNEETMAVVKKAHAMGIKRIIITHPITANLGGTPTMEMMKEYVRLGAYLEHALIGLTGRTQVITWEALVASIKEIGPQHCILSSDFGQISNPPPAYGMKSFIANLLALGLKDEEVEVMVKTNPAKLAGL
jgi:hypothetical protein